MLSAGLSARADGGHNDWLKQLDRSLDRREEFEQQKKNSIDMQKNLLSQAANDEERYERLYSLFESYKSYCYDSAVVYARRCEEVAVRLNDDVKVCNARCAVAFCLISAGILSEAYEIMNSLDPSKMDLPERRNYLEMNSQMYRAMADYVHDEPYYTKYITPSNAFMDSLISITPANLAIRHAYVGSRLMRDHQFKEALASFRNYLSAPDANAHGRAMVLAEMAWAYIYLDDEGKAIDCFAQSAIYDNETATREITALYHLSRLIFKRGDYERANRYVHQALADVQFYNARLRKLEIGDILPIIEEDRYKAVRSQRNWFMAASLLFVGLLAVILYAYFAIQRKNHKLAEARELIAGQLRQLQEVNSQLTEVNNRLTEADKIKTAYIGRSFYTNAEFIAKLEKTYRAIDRKITTRQYEELRSTLKESALNAERENMYAAFDQTFLKLFPQFVERYNALFEEDDRKLPADEESLTSEMRIFALIRLGITDSERIANFLNYSVHTVNTYKTRIKNRSFVANEEFERMIMEI